MVLTILVQDKAPGSQAPSDAENTAPQSGSGIRGCGVGLPIA